MHTELNINDNLFYFAFVAQMNPSRVDICENNEKNDFSNISRVLMRHN